MAIFERERSEMVFNVEILEGYELPKTTVPLELVHKLAGK